MQQQITVTGGGLLTGGGNLTASRVITLNASSVHTNSAVKFFNENYVVQPTDRAVAQNGMMSFPRTVTLPAASSLPAGEEIFVYDASGTVSNANPITIAAAAGSDLINGNTSMTIETAFGGLTFTSDGTNSWHTSAISTTSGTLLAANNLSDLSNVTTARTNLGLGTAAQQPATAFQRISRTPLIMLIIRALVLTDILRRQEPYRLPETGLYH